MLYNTGVLLVWTNKCHAKNKKIHVYLYESFGEGLY